MSFIEKILISLHLIAGIVLVGSVYMGSFIMWPVAKQTTTKGIFPFKVVIGQGTRVFRSIYFGIFQLWSTGIALLILSPPANGIETTLLIIKYICLIYITASTAYGTLVSWPKMQLATHKEAFGIYKYYIMRAYGTFVLGLIGSVLTLWYYIY